MKYSEQIGNTFGKGDTAQAVPQATQLRSITFGGKTGQTLGMTLVMMTEQTSCCDSLRSFECAVSSQAYLDFIIKTASLENIMGYWIKFISLCYINLSSMTLKKSFIRAVILGLVLDSIQYLGEQRNKISRISR